MYDVIIIGGGVVGCALAQRLSRYEGKVAVLEKNVEVCTETTKANSAIVHGGFDAKPGTLKARFNVRGNQMIPALAKELDFVYREIGSLVVAFDDEDREALDMLMERGAENGVENLELIDGERAREIEPRLSDEVVAALWCPKSGVVSPFGMCYAFIENALDNGVELFTEREVVGLEKADEGVRVKTNQGDLMARFVVNCAGLHSDEVARMAGDEDFSIIPTMGVYRILRKQAEQEISTVVFQTPTAKGKGILVTATYEGNTMVGPTASAITSELETDTLEDSLDLVDRLSKKSVPDLDLSTSIRVFTGVRAKPDTHEFMIYPSKKMEGVIQVGGIESPGLTSSPAIAEYVDGLLHEAGFDGPEKADYIGRREGIDRVAHLPEEERAKKIQEDSNYGEIICLCEQVSLGEILEAIHRPAGAKTVDGIKRRCRAGMGPCQGRRCGQKVPGILAKELGLAEEDLAQERHGDALVRSFFRDPDKEVLGTKAEDR